MHMGTRRKIVSDADGCPAHFPARLFRRTDFQINASVQYPAKLEAGRVGISLPNFMNLCKVLGVSSDYLLRESCSVRI